MDNQPYGNKAGGYGKKSLWKWVIIYLVIGGIAYYLVYAALAKRGGGYQYSVPDSETSMQP